MSATFLESMSADPAHDQVKAKGLLTMPMTFKFVVHLIFRVNMLLPLSKLSLTRLAVERSMKVAL